MASTLPSYDFTILIDALLDAGTRRFATRDFYDGSDNYYKGTLLDGPQISKQLSDLYYGVEQSSSITLRFSNGDNAIDDTWDDIVVTNADELRGRWILIQRHDPTDGTTFEFRGKITNYVLGPTVELTVEMRDDYTLETLLPLGVVTTDEFTVTALDVGKPINLCIGHCRNVPLRNIKNDLGADEYDYLIGYGTLESLWVDHANGKGVKREGVLVDASEYTFFDGAGGDYPGYSFIRFTTEQMDFSGAFHNLTADVYGIEIDHSSSERNFAIVIKNLLSNGTWGLGDSVDAASFTSAHDDLDTIGDMYCDGSVTEQRQARDIIDDLLFPARARIWRAADGEWEIAIDQTGASVLTLADSDPEYGSNCSVMSTSALSTSEALTEAVLHYALDPDNKNVPFKEMIATPIHDFGITKTYEMKFVLEDDTAERVLSYIKNRSLYSDKTLVINTGMEGRDLSEGDIVTVTAPARNLSADEYIIEKITKGITKFDLNCREYSNSIHGNLVIASPTPQTERDYPVAGPAAWVGPIIMGDGINAGAQVTMTSPGGAGDVYIAAGTINVAAWTAAPGFILGIDDTDDLAKLFCGSSVGKYISWDGTTLVVVGDITTNVGAVGGWTITTGYIYSLAGGTPTAAPTDGIVLASGNEALIVYEDAAKRVEVGYLSAGVYGIKGYDTGGANVIFELSDTQQMIGGFYFEQYDLWGGNAAIGNAATTVVMGNLDGTAKIALGASADSLTLAVGYLGSMAFDSGGVTKPLVGDLVTGNTSGATGRIFSITEGAGGWGGGNQEGTAVLDRCEGRFHDNETVTTTTGGADSWTVNEPPAAAGVDLLINGEFSVDVDPPGGWTASNATLTTEAGGAVGNCMKVDDGGAGTGYAYQSVTTIIGRWYSFRVWAEDSDTGNNGQIKVGTAADNAAYYDSGVITPDTGVFYPVLFEATTTTTVITLKCTTAAGAYYYDEVSLYEGVLPGYIVDGEGELRAGGANSWMKRSGEALDLKFESGGNLILGAAADIIMTPSDTEPALIKWSALYNMGAGITLSRGLCFWPTTVDTGFFSVGYDPTTPQYHRFGSIILAAKDAAALRVHTDATHNAGFDVYSSAVIGWARIYAEEDGKTFELRLDPSTEAFYPFAGTINLGRNADKWNQGWFSDYVIALGGIHVGGSTDPGTDNLVVDGSIYVKTTVSGKLDAVSGANLMLYFRESPNEIQCLNIAGDTYKPFGASAFNQHSPKTDIEELTEEENEEVLEELMTTKVYKYRYKRTDEAEEGEIVDGRLGTFYGIINPPKKIASDDGEGISLGNYSDFLMIGTKNILKKMALLDERLKLLEAT